MSSPTVISLFSGAGGFDWGFHRAGFKTKFACELLVDASKTLSKNLSLKIIKPDEKLDFRKSLLIQGDIKGVDFSKIRYKPDVLIGGPPCQDFSMMQGQQRQGLSGGRGKLYIEYIRAVMFLQPKVFVFENVPGLVSANDGVVYPTILSDLQNLEQRRCEVLITDSNFHAPEKPIEGYEILFSDIVDTTKLGIPQTRKRLIIIGIRKDLIQNSGSQKKLVDLKKFAFEQLCGGGGYFAKYPLSCIEIFEGRPLTELQNSYIETMKEYRTLLRGPRRAAVANWKGSTLDKLKWEIVADYLTDNQIVRDLDFDRAMEEHEELLKKLGWLGKPISETPFSDGTNKMPRQSMDVRERMYRIPPDENYSFVDGTPWEVEGKGISLIYRRAAPLKPAWTVMAYGGGGTYGYHYKRDRGQLTFRERARIQTFTDNYLFEGNGEQMRAQIGEAVPPLLGERIATIIRFVLEQL